MNFIPREKHYVIENEKGFVICVIAFFAGHLFPFIIKNGRLKRANTDQAAYRTISSGKVYARLMAQVRAIFGRNKKVVLEKQEVKDLNADDFTDPSERKRLETMERYRITVRDDGSFIKVSVVDNGETKEEKRSVPKPFLDIDSLIRSQIHIVDSILDKDKGEIATMTNTTAEISAIHKELLEWPDLDSWQKLATKKAMRETGGSLKRVTNRKKKAVRDRLKTMETVRDSLDRPNPSATAAVGALALEESKSRIKDSSGIARYNAKVKTVLEKEKKQIEKNLSSAQTAIQKLLKSYHRIWEGEEAIIKQIDRTIFLLRSVWANPYLQSARYATAMLKEAKEVLLEATNVYLNRKITLKEKEKVVSRLFSLAKADLEAALAVLRE